MALPTLPTQGQNPWFTPRNDWDLAVAARLPGNDLQAVGRGELVLNVRDFGAKGDGTTDDTAAIQTTVNRAFDVGGAVVLVPPGVYMINADGGSSVYNDQGGIAMRSGVSLNISAGATLRAKPVTTIVSKVIRVINCQNVSIYGSGVIDGNRANAVVTSGEWGYGVSINGGSNISVEGIQTVNCWGDGVNIQKLSFADHTPPRNITVDRIVSHNNRRQGISVESGWKVLIQNSIFSGTNGALPSAGIDIEPPDANGTIDFVTVRDNKIIGNDRMGIAVWESTKINNIVIQDNELDGNGVNGPQPQLRVVVGGRKFEVSGNRFRNTFGDVSAYVAGPASGGFISENEFDRDLVITGTPIISGFPRGMRVIANDILSGSLRANYIFDFRIRDNNINARPGGPCLDFSGGASVIHGIVDGNGFTGGKYGILWNTVNLASFVQVMGNTFVHSTAQAMVLKGGESLTVRNNTFEGCCLSEGDSIILELNDSSGAVRHRYLDNIFKRDPRSGTVPSNTPLYAFRSEVTLLQCRYSNNTLIGPSPFSAFPADTATGGGTILAATGEIPARPTAFRAVNASPGQPIYDTTLNRPLWRRADGAAWVDSAGTVVP